MTDDLLRQGWRSRQVQLDELSLHLVEAGSKDGSAVILLHGFPEFWWAWRHQLDALAAAGFRVIALDMRGYNISDAPHGVAYRVERLADDVAALANAQGIDRFSLVGHDWGGLVAWAFAARHAARLNRLVIMGAPHGGVWGGFVMRHPTQLLRSAYVGWFQLPLLPETMMRASDFALLRSSMSNSAAPGVFDAATLDRYVQAWSRPGRLTAMLNYYRALPRSRHTAPDGLDIPTLILWAERDSFLDKRLAQASAERCRDARVMVVPGATHWLHLEQPERVNQELVSYLL